MKDLPQLLREFVALDKEKWSTEESLTSHFYEIAKSALFGGYFDVNGTVKIHLRDIEFYFYDEGNEKGVRDMAMYHKGEKIPYFEVGSFHFHRSGLDVTFESKENKFRASFLIRGYKIDGEIIDKPAFLREEMFGYVPVCSEKGIQIKWVAEDKWIAENNCKCKISQDVRVNVRMYDEKGYPVPYDANNKEHNKHNPIKANGKLWAQDGKSWRFALVKKITK